ncbi:MAG: MauE/DoxX family redox-associated membrane protein [Thermoanaerobaculia bacterium]
MTGGGLAGGLRIFLRCAIAAVLAAAAAGKLSDLEGFAQVLRTYEALPERALRPAAVAVPAAEGLLALWLVSGRRLTGAALASAVVHLFYGAWSAVSLARGLDLPNCGCFGVFLARPLTWRTVVEDGLMAALSLLLLALARRST